MPRKKHAPAAAKSPAGRYLDLIARRFRVIRRDVPQLIEILSEKDPLMRQAALHALGQLGGREALAPLGRQLAETKTSSEAYLIERALAEVCSRDDDEDGAAEALASAVSVLGEKDGLDLLEQFPGASAMIERWTPTGLWYLRGEAFPPPVEPEIRQGE